MLSISFQLFILFLIYSNLLQIILYKITVCEFLRCLWCLFSGRPNASQIIHSNTECQIACKIHLFHLDYLNAIISNHNNCIVICQILALLYFHKPNQKKNIYLHNSLPFLFLFILKNKIRHLLFNRKIECFCFLNQILFHLFVIFFYLFTFLY